MLLFSLAKPTLRYITLKQIKQIDRTSFEKYLELVTIWFTDEWGHLHDKGETREKAIEDRKNNFVENADKIHLAFYGDLFVGAFRIEHKEFDEHLIQSQVRKGWQNKLQTNEIWFIYVAPAYRGLGAGRQMVQKIKQLSKTENAPTILLETLKPSLNHVYKIEGAEEISENYLDHNPTDVLRIRL